MTTYVYETIPTDPNEEPKLYELEQGMNEAPFTVHPKTGEPVRRVILGGFGFLQKNNPPSATDCCGDGAGCC